MTEGWINEEYLVLFSREVRISLSAKYDFAKYLPGHNLIGLRGWDDFIVDDPNGEVFSLPTIPMDLTLAEPFVLSENLAFEPDDRFKGKIKWYLKPLVFGGDPEDEENLTWVNSEEHAELVVWWNEKYREIKGQAGNA